MIDTWNPPTQKWHRPLPHIFHWTGGFTENEMDLGDVFGPLLSSCGLQAMCTSPSNAGFVISSESSSLRLLSNDLPAQISRDSYGLSLLKNSIDKPQTQTNQDLMFNPTVHLIFLLWQSMEKTCCQNSKLATNYCPICPHLSNLISYWRKRGETLKMVAHV